MADFKHTQWSGKTGGTVRMQKALVYLLRVVPLTCVYTLMAPVIPFYMLLDRRGFKASRDFFRDRMGMSGWKALLFVYANEFRMGQMVIDRFAVAAGKSFDIKVYGQDIFDRLSSGSKGFIQVSAHIGNYELAGYMLTSSCKTIYSLVFAGEKETVMQNRQTAFKHTNVVMIPVRDDLSHLFELNAAIEDGNIVSMPGDRSFGSSKTIRCPFFGTDAPFPQGPFALAASKGVPMVSCLVMKESAHKYSLFINEISADVEKSLGRNETMSAYAGAYAKVLEETVRKYPSQWFNFYNFWCDEV